MVSEKRLLFLALTSCGLLLVLSCNASATPVDTLVDKNLTVLLSTPFSSDNLDKENELNEILSNDVLITTGTDSADSSNNSEYEFYHNETDALDNSTYFRYNTTTEGAEEKCEEGDECPGNKLLRYAGHSTIIVTGLIICAVIASVACVTYHNILSMVP